MCASRARRFRISSSAFMRASSVTGGSLRHRRVRNLCCGFDTVACRDFWGRWHVSDDDQRARTGALAAPEPHLLPLKGTARDLDEARARLASWLAPRLDATGNVSVSPIWTPASTGVANETLLFDASWDAAGSQHTGGFAVRIGGDDSLYIDADLSKQALVYEALADVEGVPVPHLYGYEGDVSLLGHEFYVMERVEGEVPGDRPKWWDEGFVVDKRPDERRAMWEDAIRVLAAVHQVDVARFPFLASTDGTSGLLDHLHYWRRSLDIATGDHPHDGLERGYEWLRANLPEPQPTGFSWGDSRFPNIMFRDNRVVAIFDFDTASLAGPGPDLSWWRHFDGRSGLEGIGNAEEVVARWEAETGLTAQDIPWYDVFTTFRFGCIAMRGFAHMAAQGMISAEKAWQLGREQGSAAEIAAQLDALA